MSEDADPAAAQALQRSELRYRRLFEAAQDGILLINAGSGQIEDANPYLTRMLGYTHAELLGKKLWEVGALLDMQKSAEMFERVQVDGYARYDDLPLKTKAGRLISVEFVSNAYDCAGVRVIQCNVRNITKQRLAEDEVRKLSLVVEQSPMAIVISNMLGEIEYANAARLHSSGYSAKELLGRPVRMLQAADTSAQTQAEVDATLARGLVWRGEFASQRRDGSAFTESAIVAPIQGVDGVTTHWVTITEDITARKRDAAELDRHRHSLEALIVSRTRELDSAKLAAEAANIAKSAFLANMSHEIRSPLGAITGLAYLMGRTPLTPQQADWLSKIDVAGAHLLALVDAVLDLAKIESGKVVLDHFDVNVGSIAARVVSMLFERASAKQVKLGVEMHPMPLRLIGDAARLQQALLNYAVNAIRFTDAGSVTLRALCTEVSAESALLRFEVQDTGCGIAAEVMPRLFSSFEQADNSITRQHGGTGLGLVIVRQLARLMGGEAGVHSVPGEGSTFWFTARLRIGAGRDTAGDRQRGTVEALLARDHAGARLLVVDDDPVNREVALAMIKTVIDGVDTAEDGRSAVRQASARAYDLILMDMQMPGLGGLEATRQIRLLPGGAATVIVALTANVFAEDKAACFAAGMDDFLAKPFVADAFFAILLKGLTRSH